MKNKKGVELTLNTIIIAMIVLIAAAVIIFVFVKYYGEETGFIGDKISGLKEDSDGDGIPDTIDKCPTDKTDTCLEQQKNEEPQ